MYDQALTILNKGDKDSIRALLTFRSSSTAPEDILIKFRLWSRFYFPKFFMEKGTQLPIADAAAHDDIDRYNLAVYLGTVDSYLDIGYRGLAKTTRTKLLFAFLIANDLDHFRRYLKILSEDGDNSKQAVTDIYNLLVDPRMRVLYSELFVKSDQKREETMSTFTTSTGVKVASGTVGQAQRGDLQEDVRPDVVWFDDFETRMILRSAVKLNAIWLNMEEARDGLAKGGGRIYTANYLSERGNVHKLVEKVDGKANVMTNVPIEDDYGKPTWSRYTVADINKIKTNSEDYAGEYLGRPSASKDVMIIRSIIDGMVKLDPIKEVAGFRMYRKYDPAHRYAGGFDIAGGVGLDSSASVFIDFSTFPAQVVACFDDNDIKPESFGHEMANEGRHYGECLLAPENNKFDSAIGILKQVYPTERIFRRQPKETRVESEADINAPSRPTLPDYGWNTNAVTKGTMILSFTKAINDGLLLLNDKRLIAEARAFTRNDFMDSDVDPRLTTRHFDLFVAACIAWQMKDHAEAAPTAPVDDFVEDEPQYADIGI